MKDRKRKQEHKVYCLNCRKETIHKTVKSHRRSEGNEEFTVWFDWAILECGGCESVTFMEKSTCGEDYNLETGEMDSSIRYYPERDEHALPIKPFNNVPRKLRRIYREVIEAFNRDIHTLCAAGLRGLVEGICADRKVKRGPVKDQQSGEVNQKTNLEGKINGLVGMGFVTKRHATILHKHRFLGNDALHDLEAPTRDSLTAAIEIVEHTLENIYEISQTAKRVRRRKQPQK